MLHSKNTQVVLQPYHSYTPLIHSKLFRLWFLRSLAYYHLPFSAEPDWQVIQVLKSTSWRMEWKDCPAQMVNSWCIVMCHVYHIIELVFLVLLSQLCYATILMHLGHFLSYSAQTWLFFVLMSNWTSMDSDRGRK